jgi:uncharacterized protein YybS (DUF2232 family)
MLTRDILGCVAGAAFFLLGTAWIPFVGPFLSLLAPLPFLYYAVKLGMRRGAFLGVLTAVVIGLAARLAGFTQMLIFALEFGLLGLVLAELYRRRESIGRTILLAEGFMLLVSFGILFLFVLSSGQGPVTVTMEYLQRHLEESMRTYQEMGLSPEKSAELEAFGKQALGTLRKIFPALMVLGTGFVVWLNIMVSRPLLRARGLPAPDFGPLERWRAPEHLIWAVIAAGFSLLVLSGALWWAAVNVLIVTMTVYMFQGLSILVFLLNKYRVPTWARAGIYLLIILQQLFLLLMAMAGLFDQWIDLRRIRRSVG